MNLFPEISLKCSLYLVFQHITRPNFRKISETKGGKEMAFDKKEVGIMVTILFLLCIIEAIGCFERRKYIISESHRAFTQAILKEKELFIQKVKFQYDAQESPTPLLSAEEKKNWGDQYSLGMLDPQRYRLDSLFQRELEEHSLKIRTAIRYTVGGETTVTRPDSILSEFIPLQTLTFRRDNDKQSEIHLCAYIDIPVFALLNGWHSYLLLTISFIGIVYYYYRKRKSEIIHPKEEEQVIIHPRTLVKSVTQIEIYKGYLWNKNAHILTHEEEQIELQGECLRFFLAFIQKEDYYLSHEDLGALYTDTNDPKATKDRIYHTIDRLKKLLEKAGIQIISVRKNGYRLMFT